MTNNEKKDWLSVQYPLTVLCDRYDGTYSGAKWLAFPLYCDEIPLAVDGYDEDCAQFWKDYKEPVGKGAYASDAVTDLIRQMRESEPEESEDERIRKEINTLYSEIDTCISELLKARIDKDSEAEGKALFKMEGLMVATLQDLSCIEDYLEKQEEPHYTKRNALFDKCVAECDPAVMKKVSDEVDEMMRKEQKSVECIEFENEFTKQVSHLLASVINKENEYNKGFVEYVAQSLLGYAKHEIKPAGWNEEDEKVIRDACCWIAEYAGFLMSENKDKAQMLWKLSEKLKSLRPQPQWKPSEEQIYSLGTVVKGYGECTVGSVGYNLKELYEQLKKL